MALVCQELKGTGIVLVVRRTDNFTVYVGMHKNERKVLDAMNPVFDAKYRIINHNPVKAADTWLKSSIKLADKARGVLEMVIVKGKEYADAEALKEIGLKGLVRLFNKSVDENKQVDGFGDVDVAAASTWDALINLPVPAPKIKEKKIRVKKEKPVKEPKAPKVYAIPAKEECHEYREGTGMRNMVNALVNGATWDELAVIANTKKENVQNRVLRVMTFDGYGIHNVADKFYVTIPPYIPKKVKEPVSE